MITAQQLLELLERGKRIRGCISDAYGINEAAGPGSRKSNRQVLLQTRFELDSLLSDIERMIKG